MNKLNTTEAMKLRPRKRTQLIQANASDNYGKKIKNKVQKSTSTERMRKLRESRREDKDFDMDSHLMKECERIAELRRVQKVARERDPKLYIFSPFRLIFNGIISIDIGTKSITL